MAKGNTIDPQQGLAELHLLDIKKAEDLTAAYDRWEAQLADLLGYELYGQVLATLDARQAEMDAITAGYDERITAQQAAIKAAAVHYATSFKSGFYRVDYVQPAPSWDGKLLAGYAVAHPEIWAFAKDRAAYAKIVPLKN